MTAAQIKATRLKAGLSQTKFAAALGTTQARVSVWEWGWEQISDLYAAKIERTFNPLKPEENGKLL